ncbi:RagB/SusD family nutrient uptake outer membrane protein [Paludibacter sp. 221]|uniref:RagB/SusD family nutrient uptake outer membrane protein n=1 Tax=Paludibacter sp. 221 TaxID=2302939 RepID=UPI0013D71D9E|nr:RagB/SusD family nutrient uptake outer membrane protein [Paludibacter sp. 221]NDV47394.1 RagB/SusD family nutrient uptake outer membrane protein [Paludibacter sp. 221]
MKKILYYLFTFILLMAIQSCNFLDVVPDEISSEADAFKNRVAVERFLYSCYAYLPDPRSDATGIDLLTADEVITPYEHESFANFAKGTYGSSSRELLSVSVWNTVFQGIRQCYILIRNVDEVPDLSLEEKVRYKAEARFLIAYYHSLLLKNYGPTILVKGETDIDTNPKDFLAREHYDDCVKWIIQELDDVEGLNVLPESDAVTTSYYGRATLPIVKAVKARVLLYAASPLFNGAYSEVEGTDDLRDYYDQNFRSKDGELLVSLEYDPRKWTDAAKAFKEAIEVAEANGKSLFISRKDNMDEQPWPDNPVERDLRMTITDQSTTEIIFPSTRREGGYSLQNKSVPRIDGPKDSYWNGVSPTLSMVEAFYTENGLPFDVDPDYQYKENPYAPILQTDFSHGRGETCRFHLNREPRFYAWVNYHNGYYEIKRENTGGRVLCNFKYSGKQGLKASPDNNYSPAGYLNKKGVHPLYNQKLSGGSGVIQYAWPIIRLADLYLGYAEALIEVGGQANLDEAIVYIDKVRTRAGIPGVTEAWSKVPGVVLDQAKLREIVRQERRIELYLENQRFWDVRRWLLGTKYLKTLPRGLSVNEDGDEFFTPQTIGSVTRSFEYKNYLMPIIISDIQRNPNLKQNPGY